MPTSVSVFFLADFMNRLWINSGFAQE